ncbi:sorting nexin-25-like isoform X2 [Dreissena polymorpha]|uniref:sorting nexin-25-like isoform X2 n=1 Tax=Dreissena polymorpha TaxID=45954 RepID=UPI002264FD2A|nr:sorting nexin-25-like isoform X2 [Dreissena polymorpha]
MNYPVVIGTFGAVTAVLYYYDLVFTVFMLFAHAAIATLGIYLGVSWALVRGKQYTPPPLPKEFQQSHVRLILQNMMEVKSSQSPGPKKVVISRNMDLALQEVIDLLLRDYILSWYKGLSKDQASLLSYLQTDIWIVIENISVRLAKIDTVQFVTQDIVQKLKTHFQDVRASSKKYCPNTSTPFSLHPWLRSKEAELNYLRKMSEALLVVVLPKYYTKSTPMRHLLSEVMATTVLSPTIELICDPDYINMTLLSYIEYREKLSEATRINYTYAATYEDFVKMIEKCQDIEHLKQLRFNIMTEIMQATTIDKLKRSQSATGAEKPGSPKSSRSTDKGELLKKRNLKRYINQLQVAKTRCEKRICSLGGPAYKSYTSSTDVGAQLEGLPGQKVVAFSEILKSAKGREYFQSFLKREGNESLMGFWVGVENMKSADKKQHHHLANDIYQGYICSAGSVVRVDKSTARAMETFLIGDSGHEAFLDTQAVVYKRMETQHYPSFLVSDLYHRYLTSLETEEGNLEGTIGQNEMLFEPTEHDHEDEEMFRVQSYHAKQKLQQLGNRISNKTQALDALKTQKSDVKIQKVQEDLESEIEAMKEEKRKLESHILRTEQWCIHTGKWKALVYEVASVKDGDKMVPLFVLIVHLAGRSHTSQNLQSSSQGWVVNRKLSDFYTVHERLVQIAGPWLKKHDLPKISMFTTVDEKFLKDAKETLNNYLNAVMKDDRLANSEALYGFLTPTPEYFQQPEKKSEFILKTLLKNLPSIGQDSRETDDDLLFSTDDRADDRSKDSIAFQS